MSVTKAQLVGGVGISTVGDLSVYGGVNVSGIITATSFIGDVTGDATGLTGTPNITVGFITATGTSISGNVNVGGNVSIAGTLTYEDVTNVDSIGIVTARAGIVLGPTANTIQLGTGTTISSPSSDTFTILTGGSERVRVDSSGNFGIGTNNPLGKLDVKGSAIILNGTSANSTNLVFKVSDSVKGYVGPAGNLGGSDNDMGYRVESGYNQIFYIGASERVRISSAGGFSVGTTADPGAGAIYATGDITAFYSSDIRLKKDIEPISEPIKKLMEISGVTYKWNEEYLKDKDVDGYFVRETEVGVIAQDVEKVLPEVVATRENGYKAVRYEKLVALLIEAVKDQQKQIDELKARLEEN